MKWEDIDTLLRLYRTTSSDIRNSRKKEPTGMAEVISIETIPSSKPIDWEINDLTTVEIDQKVKSHLGEYVILQDYFRTPDDIDFRSFNIPS